MKQWQIGSAPGWEHLYMTDVPEPEAGPGQVVVRLRASSLNYRDTLVATLKERFTPGRIPLSDGAGEVIAVGPGVEKWKIGDRVCGLFFPEWHSGRFDMRYHQTALGGPVDGVLREMARFDQNALIRIPDFLSMEEAATLPCAGLTAWYALMTRGEYTPGDSALLIGTGGVSIWALQILAASGGQTIITSSSDEKLARARTLGATHTINYRQTPSWGQEVLTLMGKRGVDHVVEVGGPGTLGQSLQSLAAGGHLAQIGVLTGFDPAPTSLFPLVGKNAQMSGIYVGHAEAFRTFLAFLEQTKIKPVIDRVFNFSEAPAAYAHLASGQHFGKVVIRH
jgi:NADPH:quinone reductase-like Zn-dependent oxidoreductase